jgi:L-fucose isomerase-like protein
MLELSQKAGFVFFGRRRPGFDEEWGSAMASRVRSATGDRRWTSYHCPTRAVDDETLRQAVDECRAARCDTVVAVQTTMSDGRLAPVFFQLWGGPVVFWATPENQDGDLVSSCSLVGTHLFASMAARMAVPFEVLSGAPDDERTLGDLDVAVLTTSAWSGMKRSKAGLIGYHAPGFINMHTDPYLTHRHLGCELYHTGQQDLLSAMETIADDEVDEDLAATIKLGMPLVDLEPDDLRIQSRYYLALRTMMKDEHLDALALRCWPELPNRTGQWPYLALVRLGDEGACINMEGDVDGALGMLIMRHLGIDPGYLTDWLEHDGNVITTWHGGGTPACLAEPTGSPHARTIARHFNSGKPAVVDGWIRSNEPVTLLRIWGDTEGYTMMVREATTVENRRHLRGTNGRVQLHAESAGELFDTCCHAGMPHHLSVAPGHHAAILRRAARILGMKTI